MDRKVFPVLFVFLVFSGAFQALAGIHHHRKHSPNGSTLAGIEFHDHLSFNVVSSSASTGCGLSTTKKSEQSESIMQVITNEAAKEEEYDSDDEDGDVIVSAEQLKQSVKLHLKHNPLRQQTGLKNSAVEFTVKDLTRIQTLHTRITEKKNQNTISRLRKEKSVVAPAASPESYAGGVEREKLSYDVVF